MGKAFLREDHFKDALVINDDALAEYMTKMIEGPYAAILMDQHGMIGVQIGRHPMSGEWVASESFWYVTLGHRNGLGRDLMQAAERWAKSKGARRFQMSAPDARVGNVLIRRGFRSLETTYQKDL
jgi:GNAT superfamily N-acetyltransferase